VGLDGSGPDNKVSSGPFAGWTPTYDAGPDYTTFTPLTPFLQRTLGKKVNSLPTDDEWEAAKIITGYDATPYDSNTGKRPPALQFIGGTSFRNTLEGWVGYYPTLADLAGADPDHSPPALHNRVHVWVGGSMSPLSSPNDPVFFLHHCNVDRLWAEWQREHPAWKYKPADGEPNPNDPIGERDPMGNPTGPETIDLTGHHLNDPMPPWDGRAATRKGVTGNMPTVKPANVLNHVPLGYSYDTDPPSLTAAGHP
jgi:tyrosinase